jgi:hypothetical protein
MYLPFRPRVTELLSGTGTDLRYGVGGLFVPVAACGVGLAGGALPPAITLVIKRRRSGAASC